MAFGLTYKVGECVLELLYIILGVLCTATCRANTLFPPIMSKQVYVYDVSSSEQLKMRQKLFHEGIHKLFEQFLTRVFPFLRVKLGPFPLNLGNK